MLYSARPTKGIHLVTFCVHLSTVPLSITRHDNDPQLREQQQRWSVPVVHVWRQWERMAELSAHPEHVQQQHMSAYVSEHAFCPACTHLQHSCICTWRQRRKAGILVLTLGAIVITHYIRLIWIQSVLPLPRCQVINALKPRRLFILTLSISHVSIHLCYCDGRGNVTL